jgi:hypothetical protein
LQKLITLRLKGKHTELQMKTRLKHTELQKLITLRLKGKRTLLQMLMTSILDKSIQTKKFGCLECKEWQDWRRGWPHYEGHCFRCFCEKFPTHEKVRTKARVELQVRVFMDSNFADFVHDRPLHTAHCDCNHRHRVDHRRVVGDTLLCIETDEHHHRGYDKDDEQARYHDVICAWGGKLCFVHFNPDGHGPPLEERLERLRVEVTRHIERLERGENTAYLEVHHLFYPEGTPDLYEESKPEWLEAGATSI